MRTDDTRFAGDTHKEAQKEERLRKKHFRMAKAAAWSLGLGIGCFIAMLIAPLIAGGESTQASAAFKGFGFLLAGYGAAQLFLLGFLRRHALFLGSLLTYIAVPALALWLLTRLSS